MNRVASFLLAVAVLPACALTDPDDTECTDGKCDGTGGGTCPDKRYANGTCDLELDCAVPDIDCFHVFADDELAATWYTEFEAKLAQESGGTPRATMPTSHPEFARTRALLDRGWEAFRESRPVGQLGNKRPALVLVDDASVNAFVVPDTDLKRAGFAVMVHTGLLAQPGTEDAMLGLMMHELQHAVGLHVLPEVKQRFNTFYVAPEGKEPIGRQQADDTRVRTAASAWMAAGVEIGTVTNADLGGMPFGGDLFRVLRTVLQRGLQTNAVACTKSRDAINQISIDLGTKTDPVSGAIATDPTIKTRVDAAFAQLKSECLANFTMGFTEVVASIAGTTTDVIEAALTPEDRALVAGKHIVDAIRLLGEDRRTRMRTIEAAFARDTGRPWSAVRYFSTEEDADDVSVPVLRGAGFSPTGLGEFLAPLVGAGEAACKALIDSGKVPSYGVDLVDSHHGTCWRVYHIAAYAKATAKRQRDARPLALHAAPPKKLLPPLLRDVVAY